MMKIQPKRVRSLLGHSTATTQNKKNKDNGFLYQQSVSIPVLTVNFMAFSNKTPQQGIIFQPAIPGQKVIYP
jgi:hypothetical protein